jgi:hypothetical protein
MPYREEGAFAFVELAPARTSSASTVSRIAKKGAWFGVVPT